MSNRLLANNQPAICKVLMMLALVLPWLIPFAPGPSPTVVPWLFAMATAMGLFILTLIHRRAIGPQSAPELSHSYCLISAWAWMLAGLISSAIGLLQYFGVADSFSPWMNHAAFGEAFANLRQRNQFATLTNMAFASLICLAVSFPADLKIGVWAVKRTQMLTLLAAGLLATGNAVSSSRTGLVQFFLLFVLCGVWQQWRRSGIRCILLVGVLTYCIAAVALPLLAGLDPSLHGLAARLLAGDEACVSRLTLWSNVLHLIAQRPLSGWGWGGLDYAHYVTLYDGPRFCGILDNAHNLPLQLAVELGVPVALLICGSFSWWVLRQRPWRETVPTRQLAWSVMAVILLHSMLEYPLWYGPFQVAFGLCIGLLWQTGEASKGDWARLKFIRDSLVSPVFQALFAIFLIVIVNYAAWDYRRVSQIYLQPQERDAAYREDTLAKIQGSWLFADQVSFAQLLLTPLTRDNAQWTFNTAAELLHYSPEPRVIEKTIESAVMLGRNDEAVAHLARYRAAFPEDYARWTQTNAKALSALQLSK